VVVDGSIVDPRSASQLQELVLWLALRFDAGPAPRM
jgi:hypothetical protein